MIYTMASLLLSMVPHPTDAYNVTVLLTLAPTKQVIIRFKLSPKTWWPRTSITLTPSL